MQAAQRRLDELVLGVLAPEETARKPDAVEPAADRSDDRLVTIELCDEDEFSTTQFVRYSSPYDKVDIEPMRESTPRMARPKTTTYAPTVQVFDPAWFDKPMHESADDIAAPPRATWWWLVVSIAIAASVVTALSLAL